MQVNRGCKSFMFKTKFAVRHYRVSIVKTFFLLYVLYSLAKNRFCWCSFIQFTHQNRDMAMNFHIQVCQSPFQILQHYLNNPILKLCCVELGFFALVK